MTDTAQLVLDPSWLASKLGQAVTAVRVRDQEKMGGMSGEFNFLDVDLESGPPMVVAVKTSPKELTQQRVVLGTAREAMFYNDFAPRLGLAGVPKSYYAEADMATGAMLVILECKQNAVPAGVFFGPGNPNNWAIKDKLAAMCEGNPSAAAVTLDAFRLYAQMHATYWNDSSLFDKEYLRGSSWFQGKGRETWEGSQKMASDGWAQGKEARADGTSPVKWDAHLVACLDAGFAKVDWDAYQDELKHRPFSLVHGDAHPHNALWCNQRSDKACLSLIDFEMVGVGSPAQDLGQWVISHMTPEERRACEDDILAAYHTELTDTLRAQGKAAEADTVTMEDVRAEYVRGGVGRWAWFIPFFAGMPAMAQYFHDQLAAFLSDHVPNPADSPMPRV